MALIKIANAKKGEGEREGLERNTFKFFKGPIHSFNVIYPLINRHGLF